MKVSIKGGDVSMSRADETNLSSQNKKKLRDKTEPSKTHYVPENQLNSLQQLTMLAYLHSSQVAGFGVKKKRPL